MKFDHLSKCYKRDTKKFMDFRRLGLIDTKVLKNVQSAANFLLIDIFKNDF